MNRSEAVDQIFSSKSQRERLDAARVLALTATAADVPDLKRALRDERVSWIRSALETALARALAQDPEQDDSDENIEALSSEEELLAEVYARAIQELTDRFVHEFRPLVGLARLSASSEVPNHESSRVWSVLTQMQDLLAAIDTLGQAAALASPVEFDLGELAREIATSCSRELEVRLGDSVPSIRPDGPSFVPVLADRDLVAIALRNGLRNALEASVGRSEPVVLTWGQSDTEFWIAVLDRGEGLRGDRQDCFVIGSSTKAGHSGMGLAIARRASTTLGGEIELGMDRDGVTRFELRCPKGVLR